MTSQCPDPKICFIEFIIEGELINGDGTVFRAGDFVSFQPGTRHNSWIETGCVATGFEWRRQGKAAA